MYMLPSIRTNNADRNADRSHHFSHHFSHRSLVAQLILAVCCGWFMMALSALLPLPVFAQANGLKLASTAKGEPITIGYSIVASDPGGQPPLKAARLAVEEINAAGGVLGRPLRLLVSYNPTKDYTKVSSIINKLIDRGAEAIITSGGSAMTLKAAETTIPRQKLIITASSSSPKISELTDYDLVWRTIPSDVFQARVAARLLDSLQYKRVGVIHINNPYGIGLAATFKLEFEQRGGKVIADVGYKDLTEYKSVDMKIYLQKLYEQKPDAIYLVSYGEDGAAIINQSYNEKFIGSANYRPLFLGCDANYNTDLTSGVESWSRMERMLGVAYAHPRNSAAFDSFFARFSQYEPVQDSADIANATLATLLNIESTKTYAATAYDAIYLLALAMEKSKATDARSISIALPQVAGAVKTAPLFTAADYKKAVTVLRQGKDIDFNGTSGTLDFNDKGDVTSGTYNVWQIFSGGFKEVGTAEITAASSGIALKVDEDVIANSTIFKSDTVRVGVCIGESDPSSLAMLRSIRMAVDEVNAAGGLLGKPVDVVPAFVPTGDYAKVPEKVQALANKRIVALISGGGSAATLKACDVSVPRNLLTITASSTTPKLSTLKDSNLVWRTIPSDVFQARVAARLMDSLKLKKAAVIYVKNSYGTELFAGFKQAFEERQGKIVAEVSYNEKNTYSDKDFASLLKTLYTSKPDVIYVVSYDTDGIAIANAMKKTKPAGAQPKIFGSDGLYNNNFLIGGDPSMLEGMTGLAYIHPKNDANYEQFLQRFKGFKPANVDSVAIADASLASLLEVEATNSYAATAYDALFALALAIAKGSSVAPRDIAANLPVVAKASAGAETVNVGEFGKAMAMLKDGKSINYEGASGNLEFDANGDVTTGSYIYWKITSGKFVELGTISFP
jgi:branched-chain amino acid transport system substrate-binding protein